MYIISSLICQFIFSGFERNSSFPQVQKVGAFAGFRDQEQQKSDYDDIPFMALLQPNDSQPECQCGAQPPDGDVTDGRTTEPMDQNSSRSTGSSNKSTSSQASVHEDFVMVELVGGI